MSLVAFMGKIWQELNYAHYSPVLTGRIYVFDKTYDLYTPDSEQVDAFMGCVLLSGRFVIAETYPYREQLQARLLRAGINCEINDVVPPGPFYKEIQK